MADWDAATVQTLLAAGIGFATLAAAGIAAADTSIETLPLLGILAVTFGWALAGMWLDERHQITLLLDRHGARMRGRGEDRTIAWRDCLTVTRRGRRVTIHSRTGNMTLPGPKSYAEAQMLEQTALDAVAAFATRRSTPPGSERCFTPIPMHPPIHRQP